jgi:sec1 family domain-containing protein 1
MLRELQKSRILSFLKSHTHPWKVLILDTHTQSIISPLLKIKELRDCGITSYFLISNTRYPISNTPAIYFVSDVDEISKDVLDNLYSDYHIHSSSTIKRKDLEKLAVTLSRKGLGLKVSQITDQYVDFISLQDDFFTFNMIDSYIKKEDISGWRQIVTSLVSICVTLGGIPALCSTDEMTHDICKMVEEKTANNKIFSGIGNKKKPLIILINRDYDIFTPIQHVWSYSALMNDLLNLNNNKISIKNKVYDLDPSDPLWKDNRNEYFPLVVERVESSLVEYKKEMALRSIDSKSDKKSIQDTLEKAPELARKNDSVNSHISICLEMVEEIKKRSIDDFYKLEKTGYTEEDLMMISEKGTEEDILRLALSIINKDTEVAEAMLKKRNIKSESVEYFKQYRTKTTIEKSKLSNVVSSLMGNVQKFLPVREKSPISDLVENVWNNTGSYKILGSLDHKKDVSCVVVCMVGGCTYSELKTLKILEERIRVPIIYGGTEVLNARNFIDQVERSIKNN